MEEEYSYYHFARTPIRKVVETRVYRPDKYEKDKPIFKDDEGQLHLNSYRPEELSQS